MTVRGFLVYQKRHSFYKLNRRILLRGFAAARSEVNLDILLVVRELEIAIT